MAPSVYSPSAPVCVRARRIGGALALVLALVGQIWVSGASRAEGEGAWVASVRGVGRAPVPPGSALAVVAGDFSEVNSRLRPALERALTAHGFRVDPNAGLHLVYTTQLSNATSEPSTGYEVGDLREERAMDAEGPDTSPHPAQFEAVAPQVNVPLGGGEQSSLSDYALDFVVGVPGETPLWTGGVRVSLPPRDPVVVSEAMVPVLVPQIGQTVDSVQAFSD